MFVVNGLGNGGLFRRWRNDHDCVALNALVVDQQGGFVGRAVYQERLQLRFGNPFFDDRIDLEGVGLSV